MPTAEQNNTFRTLLLHGEAGRGKSNLAACAPQPHAVFCLDRPSVVHPKDGTPGYDRKNTHWTTYHVVKGIDLTKDKQTKTGNIAREVLGHLELVRLSLWNKVEAFKINTHEGEEVWPLPKTVIFEGVDFLVRHVEDQLCAEYKQPSMAEWVEASDNKFFPWQMRALRLRPIYDILTFLPSLNLCNVVVTTGLDHEQKPQKNDKGRLEMVPTGKVDPQMAGSFSQTMPRNFQDCFLATVEADKWWIVTQPTGRFANYRGIRSSQFLEPMIDVTVKDKPFNIWNKVFNINP